MKHENILAWRQAVYEVTVLSAQRGKPAPPSLSPEGNSKPSIELPDKHSKTEMTRWDEPPITRLQSSFEVAKANIESRRNKYNDWTPTIPRYRSADEEKRNSLPLPGRSTNSSAARVTGLTEAPDLMSRLGPPVSQAPHAVTCGLPAHDQQPTAVPASLAPAQGPGVKRILKRPISASFSIPNNPPKSPMYAAPSAHYEESQRHSVEDQTHGRLRSETQSSMDHGSSACYALALADESAPGEMNTNNNGTKSCFPVNDAAVPRSLNKDIALPELTENLSSLHTSGKVLNRA